MRFFPLPMQPPPPTLDFYRGVQSLRDASATTWKRLGSPKIRPKPVACLIRPLSSSFELFRSYRSLMQRCSGPTYGSIR